MALLITIIAILVAANAVTEAARAEYKVVLKTSTVSHANTNNKIYMTIDGPRMSTAPHLLNVPRKNDMERGQTDTHLVYLEDVGEFRCVRFRTTGSDGWMPEEIHIYKNRQLQYDAGKVNIWLDDKKTIKLCKSNAPRKDYRIFIKTEGDSSSGTNSQVYMKIKGDRGQQWTNEIKLNVPNKNDLERNSVDTHDLTLENVGNIRCVLFRIDGRDGWKVKQVLVYSRDGNTKFVFNHGMKPLYDSGRLGVWLDNYETKVFC